MICAEENMVGLDVATLIPVDMGETLVTRHRTQSSAVGDLGKKLLQSSREGDMKAVQDLLSKGAPFNSDWLGTSALHLAVMNNHFETCEALLRAGIGKDSRTKVDRTPLHFAAYEGHADIAKLLLENGVEVDCRDMLRMTPLHWAVERGHSECAHILLNYGADPKAESKFKKTPLSISINMGWTEMTETLKITSTLEATQSIQITEENMEQEPGPEFVLREEDDMQNFSMKTEEPQMNEIENEPMDSEKEAQNALAALLPQVEESTNEATMQLLKEHGITMLPTDNSNTVTSAVQSGRKIVLSDAGKLVLKDCKFQKEPPKPVDIKNKPTILPTGKLKSTKIYTMSSSQFLAITGQSKPNILQKVPLDTIKKAASNAGLNFVQIPKKGQVLNMVPGKVTPLAKNVNIVNTIPHKNSPSTITVVKKAKADVLTVPHSAIKGEIINLNQLTGQGKKPQLIQLKSGTGMGMGNSVKIVMNKNSLGKFMSQMPLSSAQISNGNIIQKSNSPLKTTIAIENKKSDGMFLTNIIDNSSELEKLKSELALAKIEIEQYKKKVQSMQSEILVYKNKLKCNVSALMDIESGSIE